MTKETLVNALAINELSACPFCRSKAEHVHDGATWAGGAHYIECMSCGACSKWFSSVSDAFNSWNLRDPDLAEAVSAVSDLMVHTDTLEAEKVELVEALKPFADCCDQIADTEDDEEWAKFRLLVKDYRKARAAITKATPEDRGHG